MLLVWFVARGGWRGGQRSGTEQAREILARRYANGELSTEEYRERLGELHEQRPSAVVRQE